MLYDTAGRIDETLSHRFKEQGLPLEYNTNIIPPEGDTSTLFVCSGMQLLKPRFTNPDNRGHGNIQYCVRTNDIGCVGDGEHLTFFQMVGSFGFGTNDYEKHVEMWTSIMVDLSVDIDHVDVHPDSQHRPLWEHRGFRVYDNLKCLWSDGNVGGYCSELFTPSGLEIGNLVNPLGHSVDVGFGYERLLQIVSGVERVDSTPLFRTDLDYVSRDHYRTLCVFYNQGVMPGNKGRNYVCRRLLRRYMRLNSNRRSDPFSEWVEPELVKLNKSMRDGKRYYRHHGPQTVEFWRDTFGIMPEEVPLLG